MTTPSRSLPAAHRHRAARAADLLPAFDLAALLVAGHFALAVCTGNAVAPPGMDELHRLTWVAAVIAPFVLYDPHFGTSDGDDATFAGRFLVFLGLIGAITFAGRWLEHAPAGWPAAWLGAAVLLTSASRMGFARLLRRDAPRAGPGPRGGTPIPVIGRVGDLLPVTVLADRPIKRWSAVLKAGGDFVLACTITVLLLPILGVIALAIRLDSPGPVVFTQRRHGLNNAEFDIYKFRTMRVAPAVQALQQTVRGDARVTRVGRFLRKWSLDELPQIFNVLEGTMALVGPRPHAVNMRTEQRLGHEITDSYPHRHRVKPGITGWSQVNGARGPTDTMAQLERRVQLDLYYVEHWSPLLDLKILVLTCREVLRATNAY